MENRPWNVGILRLECRCSRNLWNLDLSISLWGFTHDPRSTHGLCSVGVNGSSRVTQSRARPQLGVQGTSRPAGSTETLIAPTLCLGSAWLPRGRAGPASSRHQRPPPAPSQTSRCFPLCPTCSTSQPSIPGASAAALCPLSPSTSVSAGSSSGCGGPPAGSC